MEADAMPRITFTRKKGAGKKEKEFCMLKGQMTVPGLFLFPMNQ